jgi:hypothetical protein
VRPADLREKAGRSRNTARKLAAGISKCSPGTRLLDHLQTIEAASVDSACSGHVARPEFGGRARFQITGSRPRLRIPSPLVCRESGVGARPLHSIRGSCGRPRLTIEFLQRWFWRPEPASRFAYIVKCSRIRLAASRAPRRQPYSIRGPGWCPATLALASRKGYS